MFGRGTGRADGPPEAIRRLSESANNDGQPHWVSIGSIFGWNHDNQAKLLLFNRPVMSDQLPDPLNANAQEPFKTTFLTRLTRTR